MTGDFASFMLVAPLLVVAFGGLAMMLADAFAKERAELSIVSAVILLAAAAISLGLWFNPVSATGENAELFTAYLASDRLAHFLDLVICGGAALAALLAGGYLREYGLERGEFYVILLFSAFGAMALGRATDLLSLFVALETMSLGIYGLVAFRRSSPKAAEGALKYFLLGSFASAVLLFGMSLLYGATGHTNLTEIAAVVTAGDAEPNILLLSMLLLVVGLAFKVSAVPFHAWAPDAYEGAVTPVTTYMAVVVKAAVFGVMIRVFLEALGDESVANADSGWPPAFAGLAAITLVFGNLAALIQKSIKRMLAYSSISHAGFMLLGLVAAWKTDSGVGLSALLYYLAAYTVSNVLAFASLILVGSRGKEAVSYDDLAGVGRRHPWVGVPMALGVLSLMGFPPLAGFFGKYYVILAAVEGGGGLVWLSVLAVIFSAVGAYYYLRVLVVMYMKEPEEGVTPEDYLALVSQVADPTQAVEWTTFLYDAGIALVAGGVAGALATMGGGSRDESAAEPAA